MTTKKAPVKMRKHYPLKVKKFSAYLSPKVDRDVRRACKKSGMSLSMFAERSFMQALVLQYFPPRQE